MDAKPAAERRKATGYSRRIVWLGAFVVIAALAYTGAWFHFADRLVREAGSALQGLRAAGTVASCENPTARGYPFRLGLHCDGVAFSNAADGVRISAGAFRSAAQIYDLTRLVAELDGPASIALPGADRLHLDWQGLRASVRLGRQLPERVSVEASTLAASGPAGEMFGAVDSLEAHFRPNGADIDLAARFAGLTIDPTLAGAESLPELSGQIDLSLADGVGLATGTAESLRGRSGTLRLLELSTGSQTGLSLSGPFSVAVDGLLDADLTLRLRDPPGLAAVLSRSFPAAGDRISLGFSGLSTLGSEPSLPLRIVRGRATLGFIPLGDIPALD